MKEKVKPIESKPDETGEESKRQRSSIGFPYTDYENAASLATAIHGNVGHGQCSMGQLAAWLNRSVNSSGFRTDLAAARLFGLIESDNPESLRLTDLGRRIADPAQARAAKAEAFLKVPLFKALYEKYKDAITPPPGALEREIVDLGVGEKQKARARQVFENSADQTGFREAAPNKLVAPAVFKPQNPEEKRKHGGNGGGGSDLNLDPLLLELLRKVPTASDGWPADKRVRWFKTFAMNVSQVFDPDDAPIELEIELKK